MSLPTLFDICTPREDVLDEEAAHWLGMAMHRKNPRQVLKALRYLLTEPKRKSPLGL